MASHIVNILLLPVFAHYLSPVEMGILTMVWVFASVCKIAFRMGLDAGFLRIHYDQVSDEDKRIHAGSIAIFAAVTGLVLLAVLVATAPWIAAFLGESSGKSAAVSPLLVILASVDIYLGTFFFVPLILLRIEGRASRFALLNTIRNLASTILKVTFLVAGWGVIGVLWSDVCGTALLVLLLLPKLCSSASFTWRWAPVRASLAFGLPKLPHGLLVQVLNLADRKILVQFHGMGPVGIYDKGYALGAGVKFLSAAFEPAWQPFLFSRVREPNAPELLGRVTTYVWAAFVTTALLVATFGRELLVALTCTNPDFWPAVPVIPIVAFAYLCHGAFLLTSIGIAIEKKAHYYPIITGVAAVVNVGGNLLLIPRWSMMGAAWVTAISFVVMALLGFAISRRLYPIPYEGGRLARLLVAGLATFGLAMLVASWFPIPSHLVVRHTVSSFVTQLLPGFLLPSAGAKALVLLAFPILVLALGTARTSEIERLRSVGRRLTGRAVS